MSDLFSHILFQDLRTFDAHNSNLSKLYIINKFQFSVYFFFILYSHLCSISFYECNLYHKQPLYILY